MLHDLQQTPPPTSTRVSSWVPTCAHREDPMCPRRVGQAGGRLLVCKHLGRWNEWFNQSGA